MLSVALCDHYHHVRLALEGKDPPNYAKQNIILIGPTGVGKTYLIRNAADLIGVPFVKADATKFSETGYVGGDVEDMVRDWCGWPTATSPGPIRHHLHRRDRQDRRGQQRDGRDVSGRGVQTNLLKLMEETEVPARSPNDIAGQIQAMMDFTQRGRKAPEHHQHQAHPVHRQRRLRRPGEDHPQAPARGDDRLRAPGSVRWRPPEDVLDHAQTRDFIEFGFEPEFIGRLPVRVVCHSLNVDDLFLILKSSEGSIIRQYEQDFAAYGIEVLFARRRPAAHCRAGGRRTDRRARADDGLRAGVPRPQIRAALDQGEALCRHPRTGGPSGGSCKGSWPTRSGRSDRGPPVGGRVRAALSGEPRLAIRFTEAAADLLVPEALENRCRCASCARRASRISNSA